MKWRLVESAGRLGESTVKLVEVGGVWGGSWWSLKWRLVDSAGRLVESTVKSVEYIFSLVESAHPNRLPQAPPTSKQTQPTSTSDCTKFHLRLHQPPPQTSPIWHLSFRKLHHIPTSQLCSTKLEDPYFYLHQIGGVLWRYYLRLYLLFLDMSTKLHLRIHQPPSQTPPFWHLSFRQLHHIATSQLCSTKLEYPHYFNPPNWWSLVEILFEVEFVIFGYVK